MMLIQDRLTFMTTGKESVTRRQPYVTLRRHWGISGMCGTDNKDHLVKQCLDPLRWGITGLGTDLVNHSHINLQDVRNVHCGLGRCWECQTKVMNHHLHLPWVDGRNLGTHTNHTCKSKRGFEVKISFLSSMSLLEITQNVVQYHNWTTNPIAVQMFLLTWTVPWASWNTTSTIPITLVLTKK